MSWKLVMYILRDEINKNCKDEGTFDQIKSLGIVSKLN